MKGRSNYLCRKKLYDLTDQPVLNGLEEIEQYRAIAAWEKTTETGDRAEMADTARSQRLWHKLDARADTCLGQKCSAWEKCFITEMHRRAAESDIIIVNHHLFFADLAIKQQSENAPDAGILPEAGAVIFDEAHELEDVAGSYFGMSVSNGRFEELCRDVEASLQRNRMYTPQLSGAIKSVRERAHSFLRCCRRGQPFCLRKSPRISGGKRRRISRTATVAEAAGFGAGEIPSKPEEVFNFCRRAQELQVQLGFLMESEDRNTVFWIERRRGGTVRKRDECHFFRPRRLMWRRILKSSLFDQLECAVLTSATLAVGGEFGYIRRRLGLEHARDSVLPSHFDYESQAMLYVPPDLPDPRTPQFAAKAAERIGRCWRLHAAAPSCFSPATRR